jgi:pyruvate kinase
MKSTLARMKRTKIICTLGPACNTEEQILQLIRGGMNVARINLSHGEWAQHQETILKLKRINESLAAEGSAPVAIMLDTKGAEVRTGVVQQPIRIAKGEEVIFAHVPVKGDKTVITVDHPGFAKDVVQAESILIDNGKMTFELVRVEKNGAVVAKSLDDGEIGSRRHVNLPGANLDLPSLTEKDWEDITLGTAESIDFIALSFIREAKEVDEVREYLKKRGTSAGLIAKIETRQAVDNMEAIIEASDGIMVARGDLGAEVPFERIPVIEDQLVALSREAGKPVIVATHMLESMIDNPMPTRAEVIDIAHAATIATDSTMLSGETASGKYPLGSLDAMVRVLRATEDHLQKIAPMRDAPARTEREARAKAAVTLAISTEASALIVITRGGRTARDVCRFRPAMPVIAFTPKEEVQRSLQLSYGVTPVRIDFSDDPEATVEAALAAAKKAGHVQSGDRCVLVSDAKAHGSSVCTIQVRAIA